MNGGVPSVVEHTNSAVWVSSILNVFDAMVETGGTVKSKGEKIYIQVTTQSNYTQQQYCIVVNKINPI